MKSSRIPLQKMPKDKQIGLLALALDNPPPPDGVAPDLNELVAWQQGRVPQPRADEIKSHVARDPEIYALWRQAREAQAVVPPFQTWLNRFKLPQWIGRPERFATGAYPLAIAAALLLVIVLPQLGHSPTLSSQIDEGYQTLTPLNVSSAQWLSGLDVHEKSLEMPTSNSPNLSELKLPINAGIRQGLQDLTATHKLDGSWLAALRFYPPLQARCPEGKNCDARFAVLKEFGRWVTLNRLQCLDSTVTTQPKPDEQLSHFIEAAAGHQELSGFRRLLEQWQTEMAHDPARFCQKIAEVLKQLNT